LATTTDNALATLGGAPKIGSFLFQSLDQGKKVGGYRNMILLMFLLINFTHNVGEPKTRVGWKIRPGGTIRIYWRQVKSLAFELEHHSPS